MLVVIIMISTAAALLVKKKIPRRPNQLRPLAERLAFDSNQSIRLWWSQVDSVVPHRTRSHPGLGHGSEHGPARRADTKPASAMTPSRSVTFFATVTFKFTSSSERVFLSSLPFYSSLLLYIFPFRLESGLVIDRLAVQDYLYDLQLRTRIHFQV